MIFILIALAGFLLKSNTRLLSLISHVPVAIWPFCQVTVIVLFAQIENLEFWQKLVYTRAYRVLQT